MPREKVWRHLSVISEHAFDKLLLLDCTLAELEAALEHAEVIEVYDLEPGSSKEVQNHRAASVPGGQPRAARTDEVAERVADAAAQRRVAPEQLAGEVLSSLT